MLRSTLFAALLLALPTLALTQDNERPRARDLGIVVGVFAPGTHNAITDVRGVRVGHSTVIEAPNVRTGVTAILPHGGNAYMSRVPAAVLRKYLFERQAGYVMEVKEQVAMCLREAGLEVDRRSVLTDRTRIVISRESSSGEQQVIVRL